MRVIMMAVLLAMTAGSGAQAQAPEDDPLPVIPGIAPEILLKLREIDATMGTASLLIEAGVFHPDLDGDGVADTVFPTWVKKGRREANALVVALSSSGGQAERTWLPGDPRSIRAENGTLAATMEIRRLEDGGAASGEPKTGVVTIRYAMSPKGLVRVVPTYDTPEAFLKDLEQLGIDCSGEAKRSKKASPPEDWRDATCATKRHAISFFHDGGGADEITAQRAAAALRSADKPRGHLLAGPGWLVHVDAPAVTRSALERFLLVTAEPLRADERSQAATRPKPVGDIDPQQSMFPPYLLERVEPSYPLELRRAHIEGEVVLECIVDELGFVTVKKVLESPSDRLTEVFATAAQQWRYGPALLNGRPQAVFLVIRGKFDVDG